MGSCKLLGRRLPIQLLTCVPYLHFPVCASMQVCGAGPRVAVRQVAPPLCRCGCPLRISGWLPAMQPVGSGCCPSFATA